MAIRRGFGKLPHSERAYIMGGMGRVHSVGLVFICTWMAQTARPERAGERVVAGTVINAVSGEALAGATVVLRLSYASYGFRDRLSDRPSTSDFGRVVTDGSGNFAIPFDTDLPASMLFVSEEGFRSEDNRDVAALPMRPNGSRNVLIRLIPQSVIQGRAITDNGDPLPGIMIQAIREEIQDGVRQSRRNFASAVTGLNGEYRLASLTAGVYRLQAAGIAPNGQEGYGPVYFPQASEVTLADSLRITAGQTMTADFKLAPHPIYQVRGALNNANPTRRVSVRILRGDEPMTYPVSVGAGNRIFTIEGVPPGSYTVQAYTPDSFPTDFGEAQVTIADRDATKVQIALNPAVEVRGKVEFAGAKRSQRYAFVLAAPLSPYPPMRISPSSKAMVAVDGSFVLRNLFPGEYELSVRLPPDCYVESIMAGTVDVQQRGFSVGTGKPADLKITIRNGGGSIEGSIENAGADSLQPVLLVQKRGVAEITSLVNARGGRFLAFGLAPGDYTLYALPARQPVEYKNPEVLDTLSPFATKVSVRDGDKQFVTLKPVPPQSF